MVSLGLNGFLSGSYTDPDMPLEVFVPPKMALAMGASPWFPCACESRYSSRWGAHIWLCLGFSLLNLDVGDGQKGILEIAEDLQNAKLPHNLA